MTQEEKEKAMLADDLSAYINEEHSQEECCGFIDGYNSALSKLKKLRVADVSGCVCEEEDKHGWTTVKCCNRCGLSVEEFWNKHIY